LRNNENETNADLSRFESWQMYGSAAKVPLRLCDLAAKNENSKKNALHVRLETIMTQKLHIAM